MKRMSFFFAVIFLSACTGLTTPRETGVAVSALLDQIQIAINEIAARTKKSSLPPFQSAEVKLATESETVIEGSGALVLSAQGGKSTTNSNILTLELVPNKTTAKSSVARSGREIADYVIAAVSAVDKNKYLKLNYLTVETGLEVKEKVGGGVDVKLVGIAVKGTSTAETTAINSMKLVFSYPKSK